MKFTTLKYLLLAFLVLASGAPHAKDRTSDAITILKNKIKSMEEKIANNKKYKNSLQKDKKNMLWRLNGIKKKVDEMQNKINLNNKKINLILKNKLELKKKL
jgi:septal ring factor EnvC (AmiA/AmiB activator)